MAPGISTPATERPSIIHTASAGLPAPVSAVLGHSTSVYAPLMVGHAVTAPDAAPTTRRNDAHDGGV